MKSSPTFQIYLGRLSNLGRLKCKIRCTFWDFVPGTIDTNTSISGHGAVLLNIWSWCCFELNNYDAWLSSEFSRTPMGFERRSVASCATEGGLVICCPLDNEMQAKWFHCRLYCLDHFGVYFLTRVRALRRRQGSCWTQARMHENLWGITWVETVSSMELTRTSFEHGDD